MSNVGINGGEYRKIREWMKANLPWVCVRCGKPIDRAITTRNPRHPLSWSADHWPLARVDGGTTTIDNLQPAHLRCNSGAGQKIRADKEAAVANPRSREWGI